MGKKEKYGLGGNMKRSVLMFISDKRGSLFSVKTVLTKLDYSVEEVNEIIENGLTLKNVAYADLLNLAFSPTPCNNPDKPEKLCAHAKDGVEAVSQLALEHVFNTEEMVYISVDISRTQKRPVKK